MGVNELVNEHPLAGDAKRQLAEGRDDAVHEIVADLRLAGVACDAALVADALVSRQSAGQAA